MESLPPKTWPARSRPLEGHDSFAEAVMAAAAENLAARLRQGEIHKVKVFDKSAPVQSQLVRPAREVQRTQERAPMPR